MKATIILVFITFLANIPLEAIYLLNKTNENTVTFIITFFGRKSQTRKSYEVPSMSLINDSLGDFQATNNLNGFNVVVKWNSGASSCSVSRIPGSLQKTIDLNNASADNFNAILFRDPRTNRFSCLIRLNPADGTIPTS